MAEKMKISSIYTLECNPMHNLIETPDGKLYLFRISPFRHLSHSDLEEVKTPLPRHLYLKAVHAIPYTGSALLNLPVYGLEFAVEIS